MLPAALTILVAFVVVGLAPAALGSEAQIAQRVIFRFLFTIALPLLVIFGVLLILITRWMPIADDIWPALIGGLVIATGWLTTAIFAELAKNRDKAEKLRDYHKAIYAEIRDTLSAFYGEGTAEADAEALIGMMKQDTEFVPFIPREQHDRVYSAIVGNIEVLPRQTIDAVVAYYSQIGSITALADDMRGDGFQSLASGRRIKMYSDYMEMRKRAYALGQYTLQLINAYSSGGASAADALTKRLNTQVAGQTAQALGSE